MRPSAQLLAVCLAAWCCCGGGARAQSCGCTADETCCKDDTGYACCIDQSTYCVAPNASVAKEFPARCCPQWTIGCQTGSVGCCDPARPWQRVLTAPAAGGARAAAAPPLERASPASPGGAAAGTAVYALFTSGTSSDLNCLTIDAGTGAIVKLLPVRGPAAGYFAKFYGEQTRVFPFDSARAQFYFLDIEQQNSSPASAITLYGINPRTGMSTASTVKGATGFVMSFVYHAESGKMFMATGSRSSTSFAFFTVNLETAEATKVGTVPRGSSESASAAFYAPYMSEVSADGASVLRLGYQEVTQAKGPGLGTTSIAGGTATWVEVQPPRGEELYYSMVRRAGKDSFLSLAPSTSLNHTFAVVEWTATTAAKVVADVPDAHPPQTGATGILGYVADMTVGQLYVALVVKKEPGVLPGLNDKWEVVTVDLGTNTATASALNGRNWDRLGAETVSISGVGVAASDAVASSE